MRRLSWFDSMLRMVYTLVRPVVRFVVQGPDHDHDEPPGTLETLFPWPLRIIVIAVAWLVAWLWIGSNTAAQLGWTLEYAGVVAISLLVSAWHYIFILDLAFAILWLGFTRIEPPEPGRDRYLYWSYQLIELVNRQLAHIQAFLIWMGVLLPLSSRITFQLPALLALAFLAPGLIDAIAQALFGRPSRGAGELQFARRPVIYSAEVLGVVILVARSADQRLNLLPLVIALALVLAIRMCRHVQRRRNVARGARHVTVFRRDQRRLTRRVDVVFGPVLVLVSVVGVLALSLWARHHHEEATRGQLDGPPPDPERCVAEPGGPTDVDLSMFLVADSQIHELGGTRFPGQTELADLLVPSAVRPVELDMLGAASVAQLERAFRDVVRDAHGRPVFWAHLGDFADLGCTGELRRAATLFSTFAGPAGAAGSAHDAAARRPPLAGIAPGNHDMSFTGNFFWSPYWTDACNSRRADKRESNDWLHTLLDPEAGVVSDKARSSWPDRSGLRSWLFGTGGVVTVTELGTVLDHHLRRTVAAIFIDTSDDAAYDWGISGLFGTFSDDQAERLRGLVRDTKLENPLWIVFAHHPRGELTHASRERLDDTLAWLDDYSPGAVAGRSPDQPRVPRVLALIAAHTHRAESHRVCVAHRVIREIVIGSTIDSAQQGALLEVGTDRRGVAALRVKTVQTVARPGFTCGAGPAMIDADRCQRIVARLECEPSCAPLFDEGPGARDCSELERPTTLEGRLGDLLRSTSPVAPPEIKAAQGGRARRLLDCVCRTSSGGSTTSSCAMQGAAEPARPVAGRCEPLGTGAALDDDMLAARIAERLATGGDDALDELACLSWAASALQQHKAQGMTFASALRCAFDDRTIPAAQDTVAALAVEPCR